ncbi:MAG: PAS domain S-box-containing protein [Limisphaerales bacterium]|jgi:PAS domain S-box-containing protein
MIVEDETAVGNVVRKQLERKGFEVLEVVSNGETAIRTAVTEKPDLVLMDIHLEGAMDGIEAAKAIQKEAGIPVIYLTGDAMDDTVEEAREAQPYGYLLKPINDRELVTTIEVALYKHDMERKLKDSETRYRTLTQAMPQKVWTADTLGKATFFNSQWEFFTGMISGQCQGDLWWEAINPVDLLKFKTAWQRSIDTGETFQLECRLQGNDQKPRWHLARAVPLDAPDGSRQWFGTFTDIQDEKDREQALKDSETQKRAVFEGALDAVISMDNEGRVLEFNPAAEKIFGKPRYEVIGELLAESLLAAPSRKSHYQKLHQYLVTNTGDFLDERQEVIAMRSDNSEFPLEVAYCRVPVSGQPIFTVYGRDLTNLKPATTGEDAAFDREKLELKTRAKTLSAMVPTCCNCHQVHVPGGGWVNLEEHIVLQSDTPAIEAVCPSCESTVHPDEIEEKSLRVWAREFRRIYTD